MLFCAVDRPCVACVSCVPGVVAPWHLYRSKDQETQSEFERRSMRIAPGNPKSEFAFYRDPLLKSTLDAAFEFRDFRGHAEKRDRRFRSILKLGSDFRFVQQPQSKNVAHKCSECGSDTCCG